MTGDTINALFEFTGAFFIIGHIAALLKDKSVAGVWWPAVLFFTMWGVWNLWYYPSLDQWLSFVAGALLATCNAVYVALLVYYSRKRALL